MEGIKDFNFITIKENEGIANIKIDGKELKGITFYKIKRDTDIVNLIISISVPPINLKFVET